MIIRLFFHVSYVYYAFGLLSCQTSLQNMGIAAPDIIGVQGSASSCCEHCQQTAGCLAFTWNNTDHGTCWLKNGTAPSFNKNGDFSVIMSSPPEETYELKAGYDSTNFFDNFRFQLKNTDCGCFVNYTDKETAMANGQVKIIDKKIYMAVDNVTVLAANSTGRNSINIATMHTFTGGLWIFSIDHVPVGPGLWPAYWSYGWPVWPDRGEIDILESIDINNGEFNYNIMTLHAAYNETWRCSMPKDDWLYETGRFIAGNNVCEANSTKNGGCAIRSANGTYNKAFNQAGGGVFAMEWNDQFIRMWNFVQPNVPADILNESPNPNPATWGLPVAYLPFGENCAANHFYNHTIIIDAALCGGWVDSLFHGCEDHVRNNPADYSDAYWIINYLKIFCKPGQNCQVD